MNEMEEERARSIILIPKFYPHDLNFEPRSNHRGSFLATALLEEQDGTTLTGLTINVEYKGAIVVDRCNYEIGLFYFEHGHRKRVYQLNVCPLTKLSHKEPDKDFYGPHEHVGRSVYRVRDPKVQCGDIRGAFNFFCTRINLNFSGRLEENHGLRMD